MDAGPLHSLLSSIVVGSSQVISQSDGLHGEVLGSFRLTSSIAFLISQVSLATLSGQFFALLGLF